MHEYCQVSNILNFKKKDQRWQETANCLNNFRDKNMKERRDKSVRRLRWQDKEHQLETESAKETFSWVLFKSLFLFQKAVNGSGIFLAYHVSSKAQGILNSVLQHFYCGDFVQEEDFWFVSRVVDNELPDFFSCVDTESCPRIENNTFVLSKHMKEWQSFQYVISQSEWELCQQSQWCHVTKPAHAHPANNRPEQP